MTLEPHVRVLQASRGREHVRQRQLNQRGGWRARRVQHPTARSFGGSDIDIVDAHTCTAYDAQPPTGSGIYDLGSERRGGTDDHSIVLAEGCPELCLL